MKIKIKLSKIKTGFFRYREPDFASFGFTVVTKLTANAFYPLTQAMLPTLTAASEAYSLALINAKSRDRVMIEIKNQARNILTEQLVAVAASVTFEAQGNREKLLTCGYEMYKDKYNPSPPLGKVEGFALTDGTSAGELKTSLKAVRGAKSYAHRMTPAPLTADSQWYTITTTSRECVFTNLVSSKLYHAQVLAIGIKGQVVYSEILSRTSQ